MLKKSKALFRFELIMVVLLGLNVIYMMLHTGNMFIGKNYSFVVDKSMLLSFVYVVGLVLSGYAIVHFLSKKVAQNAARVALDDFPGFMMFADARINTNPSLTSKIETLKQEMKSAVEAMGMYDGLMSYVRKSYFIVTIFSMLITVCNYQQVDGIVYALVEAIFFSVVALSVYVLSYRGKRGVEGMQKIVNEF